MLIIKLKIIKSNFVYVYSMDTIDEYVRTIRTFKYMNQSEMIDFFLFIKNGMSFLKYK